MKKWIAFASCLVFAVPVYALLKGRGYLSVQDFMEAKNLLIVRADAKHGVQVLYGRDQVKTYAVVCLKLLNGSIAKQGEALAVDSETPLVDGRRYLLAGGEATLGGKPWPLFMDKNSAIPLPEGLKLSSLEGKDKRAQVLLILSARLKELDATARKIEEERKSLEGLLESKTAVPKQSAQPGK